MQERLVSVVIATHNRARLLEQALSSLAGQDHRPLEVVVVDDGSTDDTSQRVATLEATWRGYPGLALSYQHQRNAGPAKARNRGMRSARGDYILFMDDDDLMAPDAISQLVRALGGRRDAALAYGGHADVDAEGRTVPQLHLPAPIRSQRALLEEMIGGSWFVPIHGNLFTRQALERIGPWNAKLTSQEDDEFILRAILQDVSFFPAPGARVFYRQHVGVRRSQPGAWNAQGQARRLYDDLAIRQLAFDTLAARQELPRYHSAFVDWYRRLQERYRPLLEKTDLDRYAVLTWAREAHGSEATDRRGRATPHQDSRTPWTGPEALTA